MREELYRLVEKNQYVYIYGAGKVGKKIFKQIKSNEQTNKIKGFIVSDKSGNPDDIYNVPVIPIEELEYDGELILLSVTDVYKDEMLNLLDKYGYKNVVWSYKFLEQDMDEDSERASNSIVINVEELMCQQYKNGEFNRWDIIIGLLAIENYYQINHYGFDIYKKMQELQAEPKMTGKQCEIFKALIKSIEERGYNKKSEIIVDQSLKIIDGAKRLALVIYFKTPEVRIRVKESNKEKDYGSGWTKECFTQNEYEIIEKKVRKVSANWVKPIKGIIWPNAMSYKNEITEFIDGQYRVLHYKEYEFPKDVFELFVKGVYHIDDIADWKVKSKLNYFLHCDILRVRVLDIDMGNPDFRIAKAGKTLSRKGEILKRKVRDTFKNRIDNYHHDIIFHTADNYYQSTFLDALLPEAFSLRPFFRSICKFNWMLIKTENEYFPSDFPDSCALYKDIDLITIKEDADEIKRCAIDYLKGFDGRKYKIKVINRRTGYFINLELEDFLMFRIDISFSNECLKDEFIVQSLDNKIEKDGYYIASTKDECLYRFEDLLHYYPRCVNKERHLKYILSCFGKQLM